MKNTKICPKCGGKDIFVVDGYAGAYGRGDNIDSGLTIFSSIPVDRYVCAGCGFSEEWIRTEDIARTRSSRHAREIEK